MDLGVWDNFAVDNFACYGIATCNLIDIACSLAEPIVVITKYFSIRTIFLIFLFCDKLVYTLKSIQYFGCFFLFLLSNIFGLVNIYPW